MIKKAESYKPKEGQQSILYCYVDGDTYLENRRDKELALIFIEKDFRSYKQFDESLHSDPDLLRLVAKKDVCCDHIRIALRTVSKELALEIIDINPNAVKMIPKEYIDREMILSCPPYYQYATESMRKDRELALLAMEDFAGFYTQCLPNKFKCEKEFGLMFMKSEYGDFKKCPENLQAEFDIAKIAIDKDPTNYQILDYSLRSNKELLMMTLDKTQYTINHASYLLKDDEEVIGYALQRDPEAFRYSSDRIKEMVGDEDPVQFFKRKQLKEKLEGELAPQIAKGGKADALLDLIANSSSEEKSQQRATRNKI